MHTIIEKQKKGSFVKKIALEWPDSVDHTVWESAKEVNIYLNEALSAETFVEGLMPKIAIFVDFKTPLILNFMEHANQFKKTIAFNLENEPVAFL